MKAKYKIGDVVMLKSSRQVFNALYKHFGCKTGHDKGYAIVSTKVDMKHKDKPIKVKSMTVATNGANVYTTDECGCFVEDELELVMDKFMKKEKIALHIPTKELYSKFIGWLHDKDKKSGLDLAYSPYLDGWSNFVYNKDKEVISMASTDFINENNYIIVELTKDMLKGNKDITVGSLEQAQKYYQEYIKVDAKLKVGDRVNHKDFGDGTIRDIRACYPDSNHGSSQNCAIEFDNHRAYFHACNGYKDFIPPIKNGHGYFVGNKDLTLVKNVVDNAVKVGDMVLVKSAEELTKASNPVFPNDYKVANMICTIVETPPGVISWVDVVNPTITDTMCLQHSTMFRDQVIKINHVNIPNGVTITTDNKTWVKAVKDRETALAKCSPEDVFDLQTGIDIAVGRLNPKKNNVPKDGDKYFYVLLRGIINHCYWRDDNSDIMNYAFGNVFETYGEAEDNKDEMVNKMKEVLRRDDI